ncbi:hypothetical protein BHAOGJBA_1184 [Methylobacterium hispanicum]|uniref:Uncharacterized protein n=1 Tax=Methylobacterium hispanicum TaxID=270350 RepID=A0AAV4ZGW4_9HYPH|nr:hypothetical protein [Methylobacterium hispanicum]GJD87679.1 hypothetical protein BHAOGJBA_1184 [Methylobacterium hispanicum]
MRKELAHLIATVRDLGIRATGRSAPHCIAVGSPTETFPERLLRVAEALQAYDGAEVAKPGQHELLDDPEKLRRGLDAVLRFMELRGYDVEGALDAAASAMELKRRNRGAKPIPVLRPRAWRRESAFSPTFNHASTPWHAGAAHDPKAALDRLRGHAAAVEQSLDMLGAAKPALEDPLGACRQGVSAL